MAVELLKETNGKTSIEDGLLVYEQKIPCSHCGQPYQLHYSPGEAHRLNKWVPKAQNLVNKSHDTGHLETLAIPF